MKQRYCALISKQQGSAIALNEREILIKTTRKPREESSLPFRFLCRVAEGFGYSLGESQLPSQDPLGKAGVLSMMKRPTEVALFCGTEEARGIADDEGARAAFSGESNALDLFTPACILGKKRI